MSRCPVRVVAPLLAAAALAACGRPPAAPTVVVGSKPFTESVVLGEVAAALVRGAGHPVRHRRQLGGSRVLWKALLAGELDLYVEYTGTLSEEIFRGTVVAEPAAVAREVERHGARTGPPLGFNNTYALGVRAATAERHRLETISDLRRHPQLRFGLSTAFMRRSDGWPGLSRRYRLPQTATGLDHDLAYRALAAGEIDVTDLYSTDAEIAYYGLVTLTDDLGFFPRYDAVLVYRADLERRAPRALAALERLGGRIPEPLMVAMNAAAKLERRPEEQVAAEFLESELGLEAARIADGPATREPAPLLRHTGEHLALVAVSLGGAILVAIPLGILAARRRRAGQLILGATGIVQTIPSLALLVFMIPLLGIGAPPAILALFLYSLLPIVRNTAAGLGAIPRPLLESAEALGLPPGYRLRKVELPLAASSILAGIKTSAVINVGTATLGALIGAGGYGQPILTGIRLDDTGLILQGAVPAALLALAVQGLFDLAERAVVPRGLRI